MGIPISACLSTATIFSTENLLLLTTNSLPLTWISLSKNSHFPWPGFIDADQNASSF
jgi:hypothetical protein